jgi:O-antigen ligase
MSMKQPVFKGASTSEQLPQDQTAGLAFFFLVLYVIVLFVRPQEYVPAVQDWPLMPVLIITAFLAWLGAGNLQLKAPPFYLLAALFLYSPLTVLIAGEGAANALETVTKLIPLYLTFLLISSTALSRKRIHIMMWLMIGGAVLFSVHGIQQKYTGVGWTGEVPILGRIRYIGIFNDPNDVGLSLVTALPMAVYLMRTSRHALLKLLLLISAGLILWGISLTNSRGTILALGAILGVYSWRRYGMVNTLILGAMAIPAMFMLSSRLDTISPGEASAHGRVEAWYEGIQMLKENPVFGVGFDLFTDHHIRTAHNSYVLVLAEQGVPGYFLWFSFVGICFMLMYRLQKHRIQPDKPYATWHSLGLERPQGPGSAGGFLPPEPEQEKKEILAPEDRAIARVLFLSLVGFAVSSFFLSRSYSMQLFLLCGMAVAHYQGTRLRNPEITEYRFLDHFLFWGTLCCVSIVVLYFVVSALLSFS